MGKGFKIIIIILFLSLSVIYLMLFFKKMIDFKFEKILTNDDGLEKYENNNKYLLPFHKYKSNVIWKDAPNLTILCRAYAGSILELYNVFLVGYHLFWPIKQWKNSDLVIILDDENETDHRLATVLVNLPPYPKVLFEKYPSKNTFCSGDRRIGYTRQQYSNFYSDLYTEKEYIGIVDSDSIFMTNIVPENLFVNGKPRIIGYQIKKN